MPKVFLCMALLAFSVPAAFAQSPRLVVSSPALAAAEIESVNTLDGTRVYRLTVDLDSRKLSTGTVVEYEILTADGTAAGGGMFTASPDMVSADGATLSALTGLGGLELSPGHQVLVKIVPMTSSGGRHPVEKIGSCSGEDRSCSFKCSTRPPV